MTDRKPVNVYKSFEKVNDPFYLTQQVLNAESSIHVTLLE